MDVLYLIGFGVPPILLGLVWWGTGGVLGMGDLAAVSLQRCILESS